MLNDKRGAIGRTLARIPPEHREISFMTGQFGAYPHRSSRPDAYTNFVQYTQLSWSCQRYFSCTTARSGAPHISCSSSPSAPGMAEASTSRSSVASMCTSQLHVLNTHFLLLTGSNESWKLYAKNLPKSQHAQSAQVPPWARKAMTTYLTPPAHLGFSHRLSRL